MNTKSNIPIESAQPNESAENPIRVEPGLKQTSVASTISFVFGIGALATLFLVRPSLILAVPAILLGHIAKSSLKKSNGELVGWGKARLGKLLGYFCLIVGSLLLFFFDDYRLMIRGALESERSTTVMGATVFSDGPLGDIEEKLATGQETDFGNNETANAMAAIFRDELRKSMNQVLTRKDDRGLGLDTSEICCSCNVAEGVCFIAAIPELSLYNRAADLTLKKAAWQSAIIALREAEPDRPERPLTVALMESSACETVLKGSTHSPEEGLPPFEEIEIESAVLAELLK